MTRAHDHKHLDTYAYVHIYDRMGAGGGCGATHILLLDTALCHAATVNGKRANGIQRPRGDAHRGYAAPPLGRLPSLERMLLPARPRKRFGL